MKFNEQHAEFFTDVVFLIEATSHEYMSLWQDFSSEADRPRWPKRVLSWKQESVGSMPQVGWIGNRPIFVSIKYARLNGHRVMFYHGCSELVDHKMIEQWLRHFTEKTIGWKHCDSGNFHNCLYALEEVK